eukprot:GHVT01035608.1.p1 GENE.GHVT01035608.1~~GHVT01035608.1.p1  ORF type:complete len:287 (-),score=59.49 GHVT01035608.1:633-1493(-)
METSIPKTIRRPFYRTMAWLGGIRLHEIRYPLDAYHCLAHFFARTLVVGARPIQDASPNSVISPTDSEVVNIGDVTGPRLPQIKGATYNLRSFLGVDPWEARKPQLKFCVLYLAPHDYHHFHSPCQFEVHSRRHFSGELLPVFKGFARWLNDLFSLNERIVLSGRWRHGEFHLGAVGAYNVGNIRLTEEPALRTNRMRTQLFHLGGDVDLRKYCGRTAMTGQHLGEFRLGSTVVLIFEAPEDFRWNVKVGDRVFVGQRLGGTSAAVPPPQGSCAFYGNAQPPDAKT